MNKKKLFIIIISILFIVGLIVVFISLNKEETKNKDDITSQETVLDINWFRASSVSELKDFAKKTDKKIEANGSDIYVSDLTFGESTATYNYRVDSNDTIIGLNVGALLVSSKEENGEFVMEDVSAQELSDRINILLGWISDTLDVTIADNFYIFSENGEMLSIENEESYQQILDGTAYVELRILDADGSVWILYVERMFGYNIISCTFEHCMADSDEAKIPCNVSIE